MKKLLIPALLFAVLNLQAQNNEQKQVSLKKADAYFSNELYQPALPAYLDALKKDSENAEYNFKAGVCLLYTSKKQESIPYLEKASKKGLPAAFLYLGQVYHANNQFDLALKSYLLFKKNAPIPELQNSDVDRHIAITQRAMDLNRKPVNVLIENLGKNINSSAADYVPLVSADESLLIFTSRREGSTGGNKDNTGNYFEDLYFSTSEGKTWLPAKNMGPTVNTTGHDASVGLSADGQKLIIYKMDEGSYGGDLFISALSGNNWQSPEKIGGEINSPYWEPSGCFSADNNTIYFSSNRPGGYGGRDIYSCKKLPDGTWAKPMNLGGIINTAYDDDAPFLHADGKTLYFSSKGHSTIGGFDIFKAIMQPEGLWSLPENIGFPINTVDDDIYFVLSADGKHGYYSSDKDGGFGDKDIYLIKMPDEAVPVIVMKGFVTDVSTQKPLNSKITVINDATNEVQGIYQSNEATGKFLVILPPHNTYKVVIEAEKYDIKTELFNFSEMDTFEEINKDFKLNSIKLSGGLK